MASLRHPWLLRETRRHWPLMSAYERFEHGVAFLLSLVIAMLIVLALIQLLVRVVPLLLTGALDPLDHEVFQGVFGSIMTLLIALEFKHSIVRVALRRDSVVQVKTVLLIALLALSRKFVVLDATVTGPATVAALAGATLVLGLVYWLLRERDDRVAPDRAERDGDRMTAAEAGVLGAAYALLQALGVLAAGRAVMEARTAQGAAAWAVALVAFPLLALPLFLVFGQSRFADYVAARRERAGRSSRPCAAAHAGDVAAPPPAHAHPLYPRRAVRAAGQAAVHRRQRGDAAGRRRGHLRLDLRRRRRRARLRAGAVLHPA